MTNIDNMISKLMIKMLEWFQHQLNKRDPWMAFRYVLYNTQRRNIIYERIISKDKYTTREYIDDIIIDETILAKLLR